MPKKRAKTRRKVIRSANRRWYLAVAAMVLIAGIAFGAAMPPWGIFLSRKGSLVSRPASAPTPLPPEIPDASHPSKEYIYGVSRLIATEGPPSATLVAPSALVVGFNGLTLDWHDNSSDETTFSDRTRRRHLDRGRDCGGKCYPLRHRGRGCRRFAGTTVTITGAGSVTVRASQSGNTNYNAAPDVDRTFTVNKAAATISLSNLN